MPAAIYSRQSMGRSHFSEKTSKKNSDFFRLIFETWCAARRRKKIREEFDAGINQTVADINKFNLIPSRIQMNFYPNPSGITSQKPF